MDKLIIKVYQDGFSIEQALEHDDEGTITVRELIDVLKQYDFDEDIPVYINLFDQYIGLLKDWQIDIDWDNKIH